MSALRDDRGEVGLTGSALSFEPMRISDVALIGAMERRNYDFPWTDGIFRDCIRVGYRCERVLLDDELIGYGVLQVGAAEGHILNLCIDGPQRRRGHARLLLEHLTGQAQALGAETLFLEVRTSNPRAQAIYEMAGFNEVGLRKGYYDSRSGREDAIVMARSLAGAERRLMPH